ncbi:MAG: winged helix-turn-helix transcriptional regulator [Asgard group archaeon]|nr:winged helix-turn-helix transcriptional regulator [Asgard group archaeon]
MEDSLQIMKAIKNEAKQSILVYLLIYNELTLDQLSKLVNKSKSTIHHHMQQLLDLNLISEESKPGSKTIYYKIRLYRTDIHSEKTYGTDYVKELPIEFQYERLYDFLEHNTAVTVLMQNLIKLKFEKINQIRKDLKDKSESGITLYERARDQYSVIFLTSSKQAKKFEEDIMKLIVKHVEAEKNQENLIRSTAYVIFGMNIKEVLDRKINSK